MVKDWEAWHAAVYGITNSRTWLSDWTTTTFKQHYNVKQICKNLCNLGNNFDKWGSRQKVLILLTIFLCLFFYPPFDGHLRFLASLLISVQSVQPLSRVWLFATQWIAACQASLSITNTQSSLKLLSIDSGMPSSHLILCHPLLLLPQSLVHQSLFQWVNSTWDGQSTGVSALASFLPKNTQDWSPLEWTGWICMQSKGLSRVFSNTTVQKHQFFSTQLSSQSNSHIYTWLLEKP